MNRQNAAHVRVCGCCRRRNRGRLPLVVVVVQEAKGETTLAMAKGRRVERPDRVSDQVARLCSNEHDGVHETWPEIWLAKGSYVDGHRLERTLRHRQAEAKNGPGKGKQCLWRKKYRVSRKDIL